MEVNLQTFSYLGLKGQVTLTPQLYLPLANVFPLTHRNLGRWVAYTRLTPARSNDQHVEKCLGFLNPLNSDFQKKQDVQEGTNPPIFHTLFNKLNSLQRNDIAQNYRNLRRVVQHLFNLNLIISQHRHV
jgi:hypothetical protein